MKYIIFALLFCASSISQTSETTINLTNPKFELIKEIFFSKSLDFNTLPNTQTVYLTYWGSSPKAEIKYDGGNLLVTYRGNDVEQVHLQLGEKVKTISFTIQNNPVHYDEQYINKHQGKVSVEIPAVYELNNILLTLMDKYHNTNYKMHAQGEYYNDVIKWFSPFKSHEVFTKLKGINYYSFVENGPAYVFVGEGIRKSEVYSGFRAIDAIEDNLMVLAKFAKVSNFKRFYQQHQAYYSTLSTQFQQMTQPKTIWQWLEFHFPERYNSYKVFFSPLGPGNNSARMYANNGFKESVMFIASPNRYENKKESLMIQSMKISRSFFTEIDHTYVNPTSDKYIDSINTALPDLTLWYKGGSYNKPYLTFNEYMTWAVFSLYAMENYDQLDYIYILNYIEKFMTEKKGFHQFVEFNQELTRLYKNKSINEKIPDLYPLIISWMKNRSLLKVL